MSSSQLEDRQEREQDLAVANELGISIDDLNELDWSLEPHESDDGLLYGYNVYFAEGSNPEILARITGLVNNQWIRIGLLD